MSLKDLFASRRHDPAFHLGLGDIRLTLAEQEAIELAANAMSEKIRKAPHERRCAVFWDRDCDCWKSDATAEFEKLKNQQP